jgi:nucleoside-diphosphate-sugar epimerase
MKVLVTGANGFVGSTLCKKLVAGGHQVRGLVRASSDLSLLAETPIETITGSLSNKDSLGTATNGVDMIFHVAAAVTDWGTLESFRQINVEGTRNVIEAAVQNKVPRLLHVSSVAVASFSDRRNMDENAPQEPTPFPYCQTKREAEALVMSYHNQGKIEAVIVRPGDIYGPGDRVALLPLGKLLQNGQMPYIGGGRKLGAFAYIDNLVEGMILAGTTEAAFGRAYILTDGVEMSWRTYFEKLTAALGYPRPRLSINSKIAYGAASVLEGFYRLFHIQQRPPVSRYLVNHLSTDFHFSIERAKTELGYKPITDMDETIQRTAEWYKGYLALQNK